MELLLLKSPILERSESCQRHLYTEIYEYLLCTQVMFQVPGRYQRTKNDKKKIFPAIMKLSLFGKGKADNELIN
jgi:hypothetical protein